MEKELLFYNREFEDAVRKKLLIKDRPIYVSDALKVLDLDLSEIDFDIRDCDTLCQFENLEYLYIDLNFKDISFISSLEKLRELNIAFYGPIFDFKYLSKLKCLKDLFVSGGCCSDMRLENLELISDIRGLEHLGLHEFGYVDLRPLKKMQHLKEFTCGWADKVDNYDSIGSLKNLKVLMLIDLRMDDIDFLKELPFDMCLEMCGIDFKKEIDISIFDRFKEKDVSELIIKNERVFW